MRGLLRRLCNRRRSFLGRDERQLFDDVDAAAPQELHHRCVIQPCRVEFDAHRFPLLIELNTPNAVDLVQIAQSQHRRFHRMAFVPKQHFELRHATILPGKGEERSALALFK